MTTPVSALVSGHSTGTAKSREAGFSAHVHDTRLLPWTRTSERPAASSLVVRHVVAMLRHGEERSRAVIQTLVATGSTSTLVEALRAEPNVLDEAMLRSLAAARDASTFKAGLRLRPDLATSALARSLCGAAYTSTFLDIVLKAAPQLRHGVDDSGRTLADTVRADTPDLRLQGPKLRVIAGERAEA